MVDLINPIATLFASFSGAWAAFKLQSIEKQRDIDKANIALGNSALLTLMQQSNTLKLYQLDQLEPVRGHPGRHLALRAVAPFDETAPLVDVKTLHFLDSPKEHQILFNLTVEQNRYIEALKSINIRSRLLQERVQPLLLTHGFQNAADYSAAQFKAALGDALYSWLANSTDQVYFHIDRAVDSILVVKDELRNALIVRYPTAKFVNYELTGSITESMASS